MLHDAAVGLVPYDDGLCSDDAFVDCFSSDGTAVVLTLTAAVVTGCAMMDEMPW